MFTKKLTDLFSKDLLDTVSGVLGEAKKCSKGCKCEACKKVEESTEAYGKSIDSEKKKNISKSDTAKIGNLAAMLKRERQGKEKKETNGVKTEEVEIGEATTAEKNKQYIEITHVSGNKKRVPIHPTMAYKALNRYRNDPTTKSARIVQGSVTEEAEQVDEVAPPGAKYERMVKHIKKGYAKDGKLTDKEKGIAYATAWKAKNEAIDPDLEDELKATRVSAENKAKYHVTRNGKVLSTHTSKDAADVKAMKHRSNKVRMAEEIDEAFEQIDELSDAALKSYSRKALDQSKTLTGDQKVKRQVGARNAIDRLGNNTLAKEEAEQIDEISKETLGSYTVNAARSAGDQGIIAGLKIKSGEDASKQFRKLKNRQKGIETATNRLTQEEQDFIDALNDADIEQIDELSTKTLDSYRSKARKEIIDAGANDDNRLYNKRAKGYRAASKSVNKKFAKEEVELDEARGRPKKAGAKDFTIHPKTKEKLMHSNPEHMARIEKLQKTGVLQKPKTEANQHIIQQLQRAKTSMRGGETVHFTHGDSTHVPGTHAAKLLDKYAGMKPDEKEAFQKKIGHSHANLKSEL